MRPVVVSPLGGMPEVVAGDDLATLVVAALGAHDLVIQEGDVLVVSSKVASKALGLTAPGTTALEREAAVAAETLWVVAERRTADRTARVVKARSGPVMAAAGVDASNTGGHPHVLLLPHDPDAVCRALHAALVAATGVHRLGVVLSDTAGRPWRVGQTDFALGAHGLLVTEDLRGGTDADGRPLEVTTRAVADEVAAAADLVKGKTYAVPVAHVRGLPDALVPEVGGRGDRPAGVPGGLPRGGSGGGSTPGRAGKDPAGAASLVRTGPGDWFGLGRAEAVRAALGVAPGSPEADRVGVASALPEGVATRLSRAVAVALLTSPDAGVDIGPAPTPAPSDGPDDTAPGQGPGDRVATYRVVVSHEDPVDLGLVVGRLLVALHGEWLLGRLGPRTDGAVTLEVADLEP